ncbi:hypothetical protein P168DRAFT_324928 [Aspergillus campestris IBT 28561]|uniref:Uncharacterized protein n=1 Tax=Aspergillus campestris (strain IBT 28561) TaxID=1392248 RepID=A0A2I1DCC4_ASPC2|nr:uncharacterized protein P168DRAFT_324928 [Aspergillus campestris IBT 28561]PKY07528.1 hypothetical protein P168DRAFT_324928 [Aspergillus campestris IBT 28561]
MQSLPNKLLHYLSLLLCLGLLFNSQFLASAFPLALDGTDAISITPPATRDIVARGKYPSEEEINSKIVGPPKSKSLFFSKLGYIDSLNHFTDQGYKMLDHVFPDLSFEGDEEDSEFRAYIDTASRVFAKHTSGVVHVIMGHEDACTTWARVEFPALKENSGVDEIVKVKDSDPKSKETIWRKGDPVKRQGLPPWDGGECLDWDDKPPF